MRASGELLFTSLACKVPGGGYMWCNAGWFRDAVIVSKMALTGLNCSSWMLEIETNQYVCRHRGSGIAGNGRGEIDRRERYVWVMVSDYGWIESGIHEFKSINQELWYTGMQIWVPIQGISRFFHVCSQQYDGLLHFFGYDYYELWSWIME